MAWAQGLAQVQVSDGPGAGALDSAPPSHGCAAMWVGRAWGGCAKSSIMPQEVRLLRKGNCFSLN